MAINAREIKSRVITTSRLINLLYPTLSRYMERRELPTTPSRVADLQRRKILPTLRRDLATNPTLLLETLRRFADQHPERQEEVRRIIEMITNPPEEASEQEQQQT